MRRETSLLQFLIRPGFLLVFLFLLQAGRAGAQIAPAAPSGQRTEATQLPLSGRAAATGSVATTQTPVPGATTSVDTINSTVQVQGAYAGSTRGLAPFSGKLSLREAIQRGLAYNLGTIGLDQSVRQSHGQVQTARSALLPNITGSLGETAQQTDLQALGLRFNSPIPGISIPTVVGPFNYFDLRARLSQVLLDRTATRNYKSANESWRSLQYSAGDARDLVVLAVGGAYLQAVAARARVQSAQAQLDTANALYRQAAQQQAVGVVARVDADRSQVQALTQQQRLLSLQNDFAKRKIDLARMTGLPPTDEYELIEEVPSPPLLPSALKKLCTWPPTSGSTLRPRRRRCARPNWLCPRRTRSGFPSSPLTAITG